MVSRVVASLHDPARALRAAFVLWLAFAIIAWNVVFDRVIVLAGRQYVYAASIAERTSRPYVRAADWMQQATTRGVRVATAAALGILVTGGACVALADRRRRSAGP
jgi:hypothetical protein